jgi:hypothetical protein
MKRSAIVMTAWLSLCLSTVATAGEELKKEQLDRIVKAMAPMGCTEIKGEGEDEGTHYEIDDIICNGYSYDIQIDKDMKIITMVRDPRPK